MDSVVALVNHLATIDQPMLTWYGPDHERVDLSGRTTANWIIKAANLLSLEANADQDTSVWLDVPWHWRTIVWGVASWATGAQVTFTPDGAEIAVTNNPGDAHGDLETIAIALPALAREVEDLPSWALDGAADLMTQPDAWAFPAPAIAERERRLLAGNPLAQAQPTLREGPSRLVIHGDDIAAGLTVVAQAWAHGISVVIAKDDAPLENPTHVLTLGAVSPSEWRRRHGHTGSSPVPARKS